MQQANWVPAGERVKSLSMFEKHDRITNIRWKKLSMVKKIYVIRGYTFSMKKWNTKIFYSTIETSCSFNLMYVILRKYDQRKKIISIGVENQHLFECLKIVQW